MALETFRDLPDAELDRLCRRHRVRVPTVFGSAADVSTVGTERLDLLDAEHASDTARYRAIAEGEPLYESEPTAIVGTSSNGSSPGSWTSPAA